MQTIRTVTVSSGGSDVYDILLPKRCLFIELLITASVKTSEP